MAFMKQRYLLAIVMFIGMFLNYAMRVNLSVAIIAMTGSQAEEGTSSESSGSCPFPSSTITNATTSSIKPDFDWDKRTQSHILNSFFYGYMATQIPGGIMAERLSAKWVLTCGLLLTSALTVCTQFVAEWNVNAFIVLRVLEGLAEGVIIPSTYVLVSRWFPVQEISGTLSFIHSGTSIGTVVTLPLTAYLTQTTLGWQSTFYLPGMAGIFWSVIWATFLTSSPEQNSWISEDENDFIIENRGSKSLRQYSMPWLKMFSSSAVWMLAVTRFANSLIFYMFLTEIPTYMDNMFHVNITSNGLLNALYYLTIALGSTYSGYLSDTLIQRSTMRRTRIRKIFEAISLLLPAAILVAVTTVGCNWAAVAGILWAATAALSFMGGGHTPIAVDIAPKCCGPVIGFANMIGSFAGILAPLIVGEFISEENTMDQWNKAFLTVATTVVLMAVLFLIFGTAEVQEWGRIKEKDEEEGRCLLTESIKNQIRADYSI